MQTADLFSELSRPSWEGVERRREEKRGEERGEEGVGRGFQEGTVSMPHAACPGAQASPPASNDARSPGSMLLVRVRRRPRLLPMMRGLQAACCLSGCAGVPACFQGGAVSRKHRGGAKKGTGDTGGKSRQVGHVSPAVSL